MNLATEERNFQEFWNDLQRGYYSLLLKDYAPEIEGKYVYSSRVQFVSSQKEVLDHMKYALSRVRIKYRKSCSYKIYTYSYICMSVHTYILYMHTYTYIATCTIH